SDGVDPTLRIRALLARGFLLSIRGAFDEARPPLETALELCRAQGDAAGVAFALRYLGFPGAAEAAGDPSAARACLAESLAVYRRLGSDDDIALTSMYLGDILLLQDEVERARGLFEDACRLLRRLENRTVLAYPLRRLGYLARLRGDMQVAVRLNLD